MKSVSAHVQAETAKQRRQTAPRCITRPKMLKNEVCLQLLPDGWVSPFPAVNQPLFCCLESVPTPESSTIKKSKTASSAEEDDKEIFTLQVSIVCWHNRALQNLSNSLFGALLQIRGRKRYEMMKKINDGLELLEK